MGGYKIEYILEKESGQRLYLAVVDRLNETELSGLRTYLYDLYCKEKKNVNVLLFRTTKSIADYIYYSLERDESEDVAFQKSWGISKLTNFKF